MTTRDLMFALFPAILLCSAPAAAGVYDDTTDELVQAYASAVALEDLDEDGVITDMDFSIWVMDRVFANPIPDGDCNDVINITDGILALAAELSGLAADFDADDDVAAEDLAHVADNLGETDAGASKGDVTGDSNVEADDLAVVISKIGEEPAFDPIDVAVALLDPLVAVEPLAIPAQIPPGGPCPPPDPDPELCGNATCKAKCIVEGTTRRWTYRLFMIGFCGSQIEADNCCQAATAVACACSPDGFQFDCWVLAQGTYIGCLLAIPG